MFHFEHTSNGKLADIVLLAGGGPAIRTTSGEGAGAATIPVGEGTAGEGGGSLKFPTSPCWGTTPTPALA